MTTFANDAAVSASFGDQLLAFACYRCRMILGLGLALLGIVVLVRRMRDRKN
ncbi:hypothetical protein [Leucobacter manosquensis]|uniref:Uncharacterized protein n=1 Tax=Leucobacter manosquensis TaxID=2810611 RepID=A0ABS5M704_9MICO|nr:hypothetical protein [Leucobacter manosquensis]MBS3182959.1 hypothetical protein [Leucobacter manosquensis]